MTNILVKNKTNAMFIFIFYYYVLSMGINNAPAFSLSGDRTTHLKSIVKY